MMFLLIMLKSILNNIIKLRNNQNMFNLNNTIVSGTHLFFIIINGFLLLTIPKLSIYPITIKIHLLYQ